MSIALYSEFNASLSYIQPEKKNGEREEGREEMRKLKVVWSVGPLEKHLFCFGFGDRVSLCSLSGPGTHSAGQVGLKLRDVPALPAEC